MGCPALQHLADTGARPDELVTGGRVVRAGSRAGQRDRESTCAERGRAFLYVFGFDRIISDVMKLKATSPNETELAGEELNVIRLSVLCPPTTVRPHLQEGFLVTFPLPTANLLPAAAANTRLIAVVELVDPECTRSGRQTFPSIPKYSSGMRSQPRSLAASRINTEERLSLGDLTP
jgi:hypothetical protein